MQAIVIDPQSPQRVGFRSVEPPAPQATEALVRVKAISLNRGEVVYRVQGEAGTPLGWDLAGVVEQPAADGSGPARGARVAGLLHSGAWAEQAAVPVNALAELEPSVTFAQAAALPIARAHRAGGHRARRQPAGPAGAGHGRLRRSRADGLPAGLAGRRAGGRPGTAAAVGPAGAGGGRGPRGHRREHRGRGAVRPLPPDHRATRWPGAGRGHDTACPRGNLHLGRGLDRAGRHMVPVDMARMRQAPGACLRILNVYHEFEREPACPWAPAAGPARRRRKADPPSRHRGGLARDRHGRPGAARPAVSRQSGAAHPRRELTAEAGNLTESSTS